MSEHIHKTDSTNASWAIEPPVTHNLKSVKKSRLSGLQNLPIQAKLSVGAVDDPLEREADSIVDTVMRMPENSLIQRQCSDCDEKDEVHRKPMPSFIQKKGNHGGMVTSDALSSKINTSRGKGSPLSESTKSFMESRFGNDFSNVNIHTGDTATKLSRELGAKAFTVGNDVYFNSGQFAPDTSEGKRLLAHELTHTIQQGINANAVKKTLIQRDDFEPWPGQIGHDVAGTREEEGQIIREQVQRLGDPTYIQLGPMLLELNKRTCTLTVRKEINFVRAGTGDSQMSERSFNTLKARILETARTQLNGWVSINMTSSNGCGLNCPEGISVNVVTTEGTGSYSSRLNLHPDWGRENAGNIGANVSDGTIWHELGHIVLGAADEYSESDRPDGTPRPSSHVNNSDWSIMSGPNTRLALMHARHFSHLPAWLGRRFPNCNFSLNETTRPIAVEFTPTGFIGAYFDSGGQSGLLASLGLDIGIPIDRLRRLELTLGPRINYLQSGGKMALLLGFRAGLEGQFGHEGFRLGGFVEGGGIGFSNLEEGELGTLPYVEGGASAAYSIEGRLNVGAEFAAGGREFPLPVSSEFRSYYRIGLAAGINF